MDSESLCAPALIDNFSSYTLQSKSYRGCIPGTDKEGLSKWILYLLIVMGGEVERGVRQVLKSSVRRNARTIVDDFCRAQWR